MFLNSPIFYTNDKEYVLFFVSDESIWKLTAKSLECVLNDEYNLNRLVNVNSNIRNVCISEDKKWLSFVCMIEGLCDVYVISTDGGELNRITDLNASYINVLQIVNDEIIFASIHESQHMMSDKIFGIKFDVENGCKKVDEKVVYKGLHADWYHIADDHEVVQQDGYGYATWRKYQGGKTGKLWLKNHIDNKTETDEAEYKKIIDVGFNAVRPCISNGYVYFLTDMHGVGNVCRVKMYDANAKVEQCTFEKEYYVDQFYVYGNKIHYTAAGDLFIVNLNNNEEMGKDMEKRQIILKDKIFKTHLYNRQMRDDGEYKAKILECMTGYHIKNDGKRILCVIRGKVFEMPAYTSAGWNIGESGKNYSDAMYVNEQILLTEIGKKETLVMLDTEEKNRAVCLRVEYDFGHITAVSVANSGEYAAVINNRSQLLIVNLKTGEVIELIQAEYYTNRYINWSAHGRYLAYTNKVNENSASNIKAIFIYDTKTKSVTQMTEGLYEDFDPVFDPNGKYLYFLSNRNVKPESDSMRVMLHFEDISSPFLVTLQEDVSDPFLHMYDAEEKDEKEEEEKNDDGAEIKADANAVTDANVTADSTAVIADKKTVTKETEKTDLDIDFENIMHRCYVMPNTHGGYIGMNVLNKELLLYDMSETSACMTISKYNLGMQKCTEYLQNVRSIVFSTNNEHFLYIADGVMKIGEAGEAVWKKSGVIDWSRINVKINPQEEFGVIFDQAWLLVKETFAYTGNKTIDWDKLYEKYVHLVKKVSNRDELNYVIILMQGELESSHSYLTKIGDTKKRMMQNQGYLGADIRYDEKSDGYVIDYIFKGHVWSENAMQKGPLYDCKIGDVITHINGVKLSVVMRPEYVLRNTAGKTVQIKIQRMESAVQKAATEHVSGNDSIVTDVKTIDVANEITKNEIAHEIVVIKETDIIETEISKNEATSEIINADINTINTDDRDVNNDSSKKAKIKHIVKYAQILPNEMSIRYIDWVQNSKKIIKEKSDEIGYIHIPNMDTVGYEIFVKEYMAQYTKKGIIIDLRENMGGYVSPMILDILTRKRIGMTGTRFGQMNDPYETCSGKLIFLINGLTSSDGDIFAYTVSKLKLGKLVGMRTWGGVIGIMPRYELLDGGKFAIPEFPTYLLQLKDKNKRIRMTNDACKCDAEKLECCNKCYKTFDNEENVMQVENYGVMPDVMVEHSPDQKIDMQLQKAIELLMQEI